MPSTASRIAFHLKEKKKIQRITMLVIERKDVLNRWSSLDLKLSKISRLMEICRTGQKQTKASETE